LIRLGRPEEAVALIADRQDRESKNALGFILTATRAMVEGDKATAMRAVEQMRGFPDPEGIMTLVWVCGRLGERESALAWLEQAAAGYANLELILADPAVHALRGDPRFTRALEQAAERHRAAVDKWGGWRPRSA